MTDHEIIDLFFERSEQAISELIIKYGATIRKVVSNILRNAQDIEECTNDTYLQLWNSIPPNRPTYLGAYSCRIARNISLNRYRSNIAAKRNSYYDAALDELEQNVPALGTVESEYEMQELVVYLNRFLQSLWQDDRYLFMRRYWYGDAVSQIAKEMGISPHTASVRLFRIRKKLQKYLQKEGMIT